MLWMDITTTARPQCSVGTRDPYLHGAYYDLDDGFLKKCLVFML